MREEIVRRIRRRLLERELDAAICLSPENFAYVSGFVVPSQPLMRWRHAAVVIPLEGEPAYLAVDMEASTVAAHAGDTQVRVWAEFTDAAMAVLAGLLEDMGLASKRIGTELDYLPAVDHAALAAALPSASFEAFHPDLARLRELKTGDEIALMRRLARIADQAIHDALMAVSPGDSEMDIAGHLTRNVYALGATDFTLMIIATGERSVYPNVGPTERILKNGDICRVEIFAMLGGYHAGVCRTARVGAAPPHAEDIWRVLTESKYAVLDAIKPGASSAAVYQTFLDHLARLALPPISFVGHGIGLHLHEEPYLGKYSDVPLEAGMVLGVEPLVYDTGYGFGMQNKDIVLVTESGSELLSDFTNTDTLLTVR
ncbi:MAG: aminopeptidase P family protein [Gammaproteobacteria bacterium]|nr:aminopeptidase P family protein [Gammaproteobacteria bacterium]